MTQITRNLEGNMSALQPGDPVVLFLHGYGADERDLPDLMSFLPKMPWVSLRAPETTEHGGYAWFSTTNPLSPSEGEINAATDQIWAWVDANLPDDSPLIVFGFSQGALMATQLLRTRSARIAGAVIVAGFVFDGLLSGDAELKQSKPKVIYCRGVEDQRIPRDAVAKLNGWLQVHTKALTRSYEGLGHSIDQRVMSDVAGYVETVLANRG